MRYFCDPSSGSESDDDAALSRRADSIKRSSKAKGKQRAIDVDDHQTKSSAARRDSGKRVA